MEGVIAVDTGHVRLQSNAEPVARRGLLLSLAVYGMPLPGALTEGILASTYVFYAAVAPDPALAA